jgi:anti-sigma regulatory factor (Ser/Thr protein kinase)
LTSIDQEAGRLTRLVGGLLMLAQAESGKLPLNFRPVELDLLVTEVFQEMHIIAGGKVRVHLNEIDQLQVNGDRDRLKQVLINLVANAIQYTPQGGDVFLSLAKVGDQARIICRDTGPGIPSEDLPHIFERFYRAEKSRTRGKSTGFGSRSFHYKMDRGTSQRTHRRGLERGTGHHIRDLAAATQSLAFDLPACIRPAPYFRYHSSSFALEAPRFARPRRWARRSKRISASGRTTSIRRVR